jgi:hypothetical protein
MKKHLSAVRHELQKITLFSTFFLSVGITASGQVLNCNISASDSSICFGESSTLSISSANCGTLPASLQTGLNGWFPFCGNTNDLSSNSNNGTNNGATLTADINNNNNSAYSFNGTNNTINLSNPFLGGVQVSQFTMNARVKFNSLANNPNIWGKTKFWGEVNFGVDNNGKVYLSWANSITGNKYSSIVSQNGLITTNTWYDITIVFQSGTGQIFINGQPIATSLTWTAQGGAVLSNTTIENSCNFSQDANSSKFGVAINGGSPVGYLNGVLDEFKIWNYALSATQIQQNHQSSVLSTTWSSSQINQNNILVQPSQTTTYSVTVTDGISSCTDSISIQVNQPLSIFQGSDTLTICGLNTTLDATNSAAGTYSWNTGDATSNINVSASGEYHVTVTDTAGCSSSDTIFVSVIDPTITAGQSAFCLGDSTQLQSESDLSNSVDTVLFNQFTMTFGSNFNYNTTSTILGNQYLIKVQGDYTIWGCCTASGTGSPRIDGAYYFSTNGSDQPYKRINWCWNGVTPVLDTTLFRPDNDIYQSNHTYWFSFIGDGLPQNFCFLDNSYSDNNGSLNFEIFELQNIQSNLTNLWSDGTTNQTSIQVQPMQTTIYSVTVSDGVGSCTDSITIQVNNPQINAGNDLSVCAGDSIALTAEGAATYSWNNGVVNGQAFVPTVEGLYSVVGTDTLGCSNSDTLFLDLLQPTSSNIERIACDTYTAPDGNVYTSSGQYLAIIPNAESCDSTIQIALTVNNSSASTQTTAELDSYTWPVNGQTYTQSGVYTAVIQNSKGCDSTITLNLSLEFSGISELNGKEIVITPNPVDASFTLIADSKYIGNEYVLTNQQGAIVGKGTIRATKMEVNCGYLAKGIYLFQINSTDQHVIRVMKN